MADDATRLFGTDGIRGRFGEEPLTPVNLYRLGLAIGQTVAKPSQGSRAKQPQRVLIGRDTRASGPEILRELGRGLTASGLKTLDLGVVSTPGVAYCVRSIGALAGIVISASHNPAEDNGVKVFGPDGFKLADEAEADIEKLFASKLAESVPSVPVEDASRQVEAYREHVIAAGRSKTQLPLKNVKLVVDCANGAASAMAPSILRELGAVVVEHACSPDGNNINDQCGALHPELLAKRVTESGADGGVTFDGDADRLMLLDERGRVLDGDHLLAALARKLKGENNLPHDTVVGTVMANFGLEKSLAEIGVRLERTPVGDRYVVAEMLKGDFALGGEQSGHIIHLTRGSTTGDGMFNAVSVLSHVFGNSNNLGSLFSLVEKMPQVLLNVRVREKPPISSLKGTNECAQQVRHALEGKGRVLLRYSGTESLLRVMVEGEDQAAITAGARAIADAVKAELGVA